MGTERHGGTLVVDTPLGRFGVEVTSEGVCRGRLPGGPDVAAMNDDSAGASIAESAATQLTEYARGERKEFDLPLD